MSALELEKLRDYLRARAPLVEKGGAVVESGIEGLDRLLEGGFPKGGIAVLSGPEGAGRMTLAARLLAKETRAARPVAWVDASATLYPPALASAGVELSRLLVVRGAKERALFAVEQIAASGAFSVVVASGADPWLSAPRLRRVLSSSEGGNVLSLLLLEPRSAALVTEAAVKLGLSRRAAGIQVELEKHRSAPRGRRVLI